MKSIPLLTGLITLLTTTGCIVAEGGRHRHPHYESEVIVGPPVILVAPPVVVVPGVHVHGGRR